MDVNTKRLEELAQHLRDDGYSHIAAELEDIMVEWRSIGHGEGQEHAIADVNAGRVDDLIAPRLQRESQAAPDDVMDIYVPGAWKCLTCGFALSQATLFMDSGEIGCSREQVMKMTGEVCPNDGSPMARVTWRDRAIENQTWGESLMNEIIEAVGADHLPGALERIKQLAGQVRP